MNINQQDLAVSRYVGAIQQFPRLSRERESELFNRWHTQRDEEAKDELIQANLRYVVAIALKYRRYGLPLSDLLAEGSIGIMHALTKFEPEREFRFVTYSAYWIRACILTYIIRSWSMVGGGSGALRSKMFFKLRREKVRITNLVGEGEIADQMLADRFKLPKEQVVAMMARLEKRDVSLDVPVYENGLSTLVDTLPSTEANQEDVYSDSQGQRRTESVVRTALDSLDRRERFIVEHRLMADSEQEKSLAELGRILGVSRERARQLEVRAKRKLKVRIGELMAVASEQESLVRAA
jgi:RNA polymerase sigma-32 factor